MKLEPRETVGDGTVLVECTCYPGGFSPETYEGPQVWCDVHGLPSAAYEAGLRGAGESLELAHAEPTRILLAVLDGRLDDADALLAAMPEPERRNLRRAAGIVRYLATS